MPQVMSGDSNTVGGRYSMNETLLRHVFFSKLLPILPVESANRFYQEVERQEYFTVCRTLIFNVAITRDLNTILENGLDLIDMILKNEDITSEKLNTDSKQSILVITRLLCDTLEYSWDYQEKLKVNKDNNIHDNSDKIHYNETNKKTIKNTMTGFAVHKPSFHTIRPLRVDPALATRLLNTCIKIKFNTRTFNVFKGMSPDLYGNSSLKLILNKYQYYLKKHNNPEYAEKIDITVDYLLRYIGASNSKEFVEFLNLNLLNSNVNSSTTSTNYSYSIHNSHNNDNNGNSKSDNIVQCLELMGTFYLTNKNVDFFLEIITKLSNNLKQTNYQTLLYYFSSKSLLFWLMARPKEYLQLYQNLLHLNNENTDSSIRQIPNHVSSLFNDIYSNYHISSWLTTTPANATNQDKKTASTVTNLQFDNSQQDYNKKNYGDSSHSVSKNIQNLYLNPSLNDDKKNSTFFSSSVSILHRSTNDTPISHQSDNSRFTDSSNDDGLSTNLQPVTRKQSTTPSTTNNNTSSSKSNNSNITTTSGNARNNSNSTGGSNISNKNTDNNHSNSLDDLLDDENVQINSNIYALDNVLELYTNFHDTELFSHISILKFLAILLFFDVEVFTDINSLSLRGIPNLSELNEFTVKPKEMSTANNDSSTHTSRAHTPLINEEREKNASIKQFTHSLKKLTNYSSKKSRPYRFLLMILKNLNGSQLTCDASSIDSIRTLLVIMNMSSSISKCNQQIPCVNFVKRIFNIMAQTLSVGRKWNTQVSPYLSNCFVRNPKSKKHLQLEFFASALILDHSYFLSHLSLDKHLQKMNLKTLLFYSEGFRIFFYLTDKDILGEKVAFNISHFLKKLFYASADTLLKEFPYFDDNVTEIVNLILNGSILDKFDQTRTLSNIRQGEDPDAFDSERELEDLPELEVKQVSSSNIWDVKSMLPSSPSEHSIPDSCAIDERDELNETVNSNHSSRSSQDIPSLLSPTAQYSFGRDFQSRKEFQIGSPDTDRMRFSPASSFADPSRASNPHMTPSTSVYNNNSISKTLLKSPKLQQTKPISRRTSNETLKNSALSRTISKNSSILLEAENENVLEIMTDMDYTRKIMLTIFSIFKRLTNFFILSKNDDSSSRKISKEFRDIIKPIFVGLMDNNDVLENSAESFMDVFINYIDATIEETDEKKLDEFFLFTSYAITLFSAVLYDVKISHTTRRTLMQISSKLFKLRLQLFQVARDTDRFDGIKKIDRTIFPILTVTFAGGIFVSLFCNSGNMPELLQNGFTDFYESLKLYETYVGQVDKSYLYNIEFIEAISASNYSSAGNVAFQKRLKTSILKYMKFPDSILIDAVNVLYKKWLVFTKLKYLTQSELMDFRNIAGILASISGIFLVSNQELSEEYKNFPHLVAIQVDIPSKFKYFIKVQCDWLNGKDLLTRENSREILSIELHPLCYGMLFDNLKIKIKELENIDLSLPENESSFILLEQLIIIIKNILNPENKENIMVWFSINLINAIDSIMSLVENINTESPRYYKAIIQTSKMLTALELAEEHLAIKNHFSLKNRWMKTIVFWFEATLIKEYDIENLSKTHREMDLQKRDEDILFVDASVESTKTLAYLTKNLPLEVSFTNSKDEMKRSTAVVFGNYFTILLKGLKKHTNFETYPIVLKHKIVQLNDNIITALTNLSNANVEASFQFTLPMGYSSNKNVRIAFLKVFIDITANFSHTKIDFEKVQKDAVNKFIDVMIKYPVIAYQSSLICPATELDSYAASIVNAFETRNAGHVVVCELITKQIRNSLKYLDVLRRNSCATRALSLYARMKGNTYLVQILRPILCEIVDKEEFFDIENNHNHDNPEKMIELFVKYLVKIVDSISKSFMIFPPELKLISKLIYKEMKSKFPEYAEISIGSFVFLRFIGPALVSPDSENIIVSFNTKCKRSFISLAKVLQSMANGSNSFEKWPLLNPHDSVLKECTNKIKGFIFKVRDMDENIDIPVLQTPNDESFDYNFLHRFFYHHDLSIRSETVKNIHTYVELEAIKVVIQASDEFLAKMGLPLKELSNDLPYFVKENADKYPQLYEFMNRHAFKNLKAQNASSQNSVIKEVVSSTGIPILMVTYDLVAKQYDNTEDCVYSTLNIYSKLWSNRHYIVLDCTQFSSPSMDIRKVDTLFFHLIPDIALKQCIKIYYINATNSFMRYWTSTGINENPYLEAEVPFEFLNTSMDLPTIKALSLDSVQLHALQNTRITLHDIELYNEEEEQFCPVTLKVGYQYIQVLHEIPKLYTYQGNKETQVYLNDVFAIDEIASVGVSDFLTGKNEFGISFYNDSQLIFSSPKYLEVVKILYYSGTKLENDQYNITPTKFSVVDKPRYLDNMDELVAHLCLVILVNLFGDDDNVKNISYNLMVALQDAFDLDFGTKFYYSAELYIPDDTTTFLTMITKSLARSAPEITPYIWKYMLDGLESGVIGHNSVPIIIFCLSIWIPNVYEHFYVNPSEGRPELASHIMQTLIRLTVKDSGYSSLFLHQVWFKFVLDNRLTVHIVDELITYAIERDSENKNWKTIIALLTGFPTVELASQLIKRLLNLVNTFLSSLSLDSHTHSWSELTILSEISVSLFFEAPLLCQMFLPELLFVISILIDLGPITLRFTLHKLLMNICHSLIINESLDVINRKKISDISANFSRQKLNLINGFSKDKGSIISTFNTSSFTGKIAALESFTQSIISLMESTSESEVAYWKTKYKKYVMDTVFGHVSFLSGRAMIILGVLGKPYTSLHLCRDLFKESMKVFALPNINNESTFITIAHIFAYSRMAEGIDPSSGVLEELFWFSTGLIQTYHPVIFECSLWLLTTCVRRLSTYKEEQDIKESLMQLLIHSKDFSGNLLDKLEDYTGNTWSIDNFPHLIISILIKGLSIPALKGYVQDTIKSLLCITYQTYQKDKKDKLYLSYLFLVYLLRSNEEFNDIIKEMEFDDGVLNLDNAHTIPKVLIEWLMSEDQSASILLYQCTLFFVTTFCDENGKYRFLLIIRLLLQQNPESVYGVYFMMRKELRRLASFEQHAESINVSFDIMNLLVEHTDFSCLVIRSNETEQLLKDRGLDFIINFEMFDVNNLLARRSIEKNQETLLNKKKIITMLLSRMTCYV